MAKETVCRFYRASAAEELLAKVKGDYRTLRTMSCRSGRQGAASPPVPGAPKARELASWILTDPDHLDDAAKANLVQARERCPHMDALAGHVTKVAKIVTGLHGDFLDDWITAAEYHAVKNGLTLRWSSGVVEGNVNRSRRSRRSRGKCTGHASFELLRQ